MIAQESLDQFKDQRDDLVSLAVKRCEDVLTLDPAFIIRSNEANPEKPVDPARIIDSHIEFLKTEFYPLALREYLIMRGKEIYEMGQDYGNWGEVAKARQAITERLQSDERVQLARLEATRAIRDGVSVELRATFDTYSGYEPSVQELSRDISELAAKSDRLQPVPMTAESGGEATPRMTPRGLILSAGNLLRYFR